MDYESGDLSSGFFSSESSSDELKDFGGKGKDMVEMRALGYPAQDHNTTNRRLNQSNTFSVHDKILTSPYQLQKPDNI